MEGKVYAYAIIFLVIGIAGGFAVGWFATGGGLGPGVQLGTLKADSFMFVQLEITDGHMLMTKEGYT